MAVFGPGGPNFDVIKNQKNSFTRKISKSQKLRKWPKKTPITLFPMWGGKK